MKKTHILLLGITVLAALSAGRAGAQSRQERLQGHVYYLAADSLRGRKAGSADATKAAEYIIRNYEQAGLKPLFREGWYDRFTVPAYPDADFKNVVGFIEGQDPALKAEVIVLGAHYDHLGIRNDQVYNGADDNASGSAALIEIARALAGQPLRRSVIIAAFDAEEIGLHGSNHLAERLDTLGFNVKLIMSVDMVGWLKAGKSLKLEGVATIKDGREILRGQAGTLVLDLKSFERSVFTATDTEGFATMGIPTLAVTTGLKSPYHKPGDDAELIDYQGLEQVTDYLTDLSSDLATRDRFTSSGRVAPKHRSYSDYGVDFAVVAGISRNSLRFPGTSFDGKEGTGWHAGIETHLSLKYFGLRAEVLYNRLQARFPDLTDSYHSSIQLKQDELLVPLSLIIQTRRSKAPRAAAYAGGGIYYSRNLGASLTPGSPVPMDDYPSLVGLTPAPTQWGWNYTTGVRMGALQLSILRLWQMGKYFDHPDAISARRRSMLLQVKYIF